MGIAGPTRPVHQTVRLAPVTPFEGDGVWLRCALHAHTTNSDGEMSPDMLVRHYEWAGFDVLAITDHWVRTVERSTRKLLVIPSTELNATCGGESEDAHVLALGVQADPVAPGDGFAPLPEVVAWIVENGGVPYLAPTGAACARSSGRHAADSAGSRSGTRAASSRSAAATRRSTGTRRSS